MIAATLPALTGARALFALLFLFVLALRDSHAQVDVDVGGLAYVDYFYTLSSPGDEEEGLHGFTYRRLYLTTDFRLSEDFGGRARLEANEGTTGENGPVPYVKDLYLTWNYAGDHSVTMGVAPPPAFETSERMWNYRSLEKTILDFQGVVASRDFGVRFNGPVLPGGSLRYAAMLANNSASRPETDPYKRVYGQLEFNPVEHVTLTAGADHAGFGDESPLQAATRLSVLAGYSADRFAVGIEPYLYYETFDVGQDGSALGVSIFGRARISPKWEAVARIDQVREERDSERTETFLLGGIAFRPNEHVRIIPNIWIFDSSALDKAQASGRMTLDFTF